MLSRLSNEYLFEYGIESGILEISDKLERIIAFQENRGEIIELLKDALAILGVEDFDDNVSTIKLPFSEDGTGVFKIVCPRIHDEKRRPYSVIDKLIDISEEEMERKRLLHRSRLDGLTGLYNAAVARELISESIKKWGKRGKDAVMIIDCDRFKRINDMRGYLKGDPALKSISRSLRLNFRETDIIGRMGGDEFCVYMHDIPSPRLCPLKMPTFDRPDRGIEQEFRDHGEHGDRDSRSRELVRYSLETGRRTPLSGQKKRGRANCNIR